MMIGLATLYKFVVLNEAGVTVGSSGATVTIRQQKIDSSGVLVTGAEITLTNAATILSTNSGDVGVEQNNSADKNLNGYGVFQVTVPAGANGNVLLYLLNSTANPSSYPTKLPQPLAIINFASSGTASIQFQF